jgi:hypothetical protein
MGFLFSKSKIEDEAFIQKEYIQQEKLCTLCDKPIEKDSYIICGNTNAYYHYKCLIVNDNHLQTCVSCKRLHEKMHIFSKCLQIK